MKIRWYINSGETFIYEADLSQRPKYFFKNQENFMFYSFVTWSKSYIQKKREDNKKGKKKKYNQKTIKWQ